MPQNASYDYARAMAAFGIVVFHAGAPGAAIGYAALPFFLLLMLVFALPGAERRDPGAYARARWQRLMWPFFLWSGVYGALKLAEVALTPATFGDEFAPHMLLTGPAIHLWFLPFAFVCCLALSPLARMARARMLWALGLPLGLLGLALALQAARQGQALAPPLAQWAYVAPAACLGMALALTQSRPRMQAGLALGFVLLATVAGWGSGLVQLALALALLLACGQVHLPVTRASRLAAQTSMGVYLAHPLVFSLLERSTSLAKSTLLFALLATGLALAATLLARPLRDAFRAHLRQTASP